MLSFLAYYTICLQVTILTSKLFYSSLEVCCGVQSHILYSVKFQCMHIETQPYCVYKVYHVAGKFGVNYIWLKQEPLP